uniref:Uncharacterized protein n=1 Tax=Avena sativa TaxID=4498 RepID=A0ACD5Z8D2_AVESA
MQLIHPQPSAMAPHFRGFLCLSTTFCVLLCMASAISPEGEALLHWKDTLLNSTAMNSWSHTNPTCYWDGVICDDADHVTGIGLPSSGLSGTLDAFSFATFRRLKIIDLGFNNLFGSIPTNISLLVTLTALYLGNNYLVGAIPYQLTMLPKIMELELQYNQLTNLDTANLSLSPSLRNIFLRGNKLTGTFPQFILNTTSVELQEIDLSSNAFSGLIPENLQDIAPNLWQLDLSSNMFSGHIPRSLSKLTKLFILDLSKNNLTGGIPTEIRNLSGLFELDLSRNMFSGGVPKDLGKLAGLEYLYMSWNMFSGEIPKELGNLTVLGTMDLSWNMLSGGLPRSFSRIQCMRTFDVGNNLHLGGDILLEAFANWTYPRLFNIANNTFTGSINPAFCQNGGSLQGLDLSGNLLSGLFPGCLWNLHDLTYMDLSRNAFVGDVPTSMVNTSSLEYVHLANNNFTGFFPAAIKNSEGLLSLDLGGNKFSGTIPTWIGASFPLIRILRLRSNMFHGSIPWQVSQLSHIQLLDLAENNLTGSIIVSFSNFTYINSMLDMIPVSIDMGDYASHDGQMDIVWKGHDYIFTRSIALMTGIDLSSNSLSGEIPSELLNLEAIRFLNLSRNNLSGPIPRNIGNLTDVESLDLSWNKLSGPIPSSISQLMFLNYLNLSNNLLSGEIPTGNQLQTLNDPSIYSNNLRLCGVALSIPCKNGSSPTRFVGATEVHHDLETIWLYYSVIAGTVFGFWVWFGVLFFCKIWRFAFFSCIDALYQKFMQKMKGT